MAEIPEARKSGEPPMVKLTPDVMRWLGAIFVVALGSSVFVVRLGDKVESISNQIEPIARQVQTNGYDLRTLAERLRAAEILDSVREYWHARGQSDPQGR